MRTGTLTVGKLLGVSGEEVEETRVWLIAGWDTERGTGIKNSNIKKQCLNNNDSTVVNELHFCDAIYLHNFLFSN